MAYKKGNAPWIKGKKHSKETRKKMSENHARISGEQHPFYGKKHSEKSKKKMSESLKGRIISQKTREKISKNQKGRKFSAKTRKKLSESQMGNKNSMWRGGARIDSRGRKLIFKPSHPSSNSHGCLFESRLIAEKALGRYLEKNEVVHHINGDHSDNRNNNLLICYAGYHHSLHRKQEKIRRISNE